MFRVVATYFDHQGARCHEAGPWLGSQVEAQGWASALQKMGYRVRVERLHGRLGEEADDTILMELLEDL